MTYEASHGRRCLVGILTILLAGVVLTSVAEAHRISQASAQSRANAAIRAKRWNDGRSPSYCGVLNYKCSNVRPPVLPCGYHRYCWWGTSFQTARCIAIIGAGDLCWGRRVWGSAGQVNGHTGNVWVIARW